MVEPRLEGRAIGWRLSFPTNAAGKHQEHAALTLKVCVSQRHFLLRWNQEGGFQAAMAQNPLRNLLKADSGSKEVQGAASIGLVFRCLP